MGLRHNGRTMPNLVPADRAPRGPAPNSVAPSLAASATGAPDLTAREPTVPPAASAPGHSGGAEHTGWIEVDLDAITANVAALCARSAPAELMAVVKADAYGHGLVEVAGAALAGGATWLGAAQLSDALALRRAGFDVPILTWLFTPGAGLAEALEAGLDVAASASWALEEIAQASTPQRAARVHLTIDTGMAREGSTAELWPGLVQAAAELQRAGRIEVVGICSHLAAADEPGHSSVALQKAAFARALQEAERAGVTVRWRHLANSAATLLDPDTHYDLVRTGLAVYGLSPIPHVHDANALGLTPAMSLHTTLAGVKDVAAGQGVSYGHTYRTPLATKVGLVPLGYADGIPRHASNRAEVLVGGRRAKIAGRVCMDQFVVDLGPDSTAQPGDPVLLFGSGAEGEPTAQEWAEAADTISYEIVTRLSGRVPRRYTGATTASAGAAQP